MRFCIAHWRRNNFFKKCVGAAFFIERDFAGPSCLKLGGGGGGERGGEEGNSSGARRQRAKCFFQFIPLRLPRRVTEATVNSSKCRHFPAVKS